MPKPRVRKVRVSAKDHDTTIGNVVSEKDPGITKAKVVPTVATGNVIVSQPMGIHECKAEVPGSQGKEVQAGGPSQPLAPIQQIQSCSNQIYGESYSGQPTGSSHQTTVQLSWKPLAR